MPLNHMFFIGRPRATIHMFHWTNEVAVNRTSRMLRKDEVTMPKVPTDVGGTVASPQKDLRVPQYRVEMEFGRIRDVPGMAC